MPCERKHIEAIRDLLNSTFGYKEWPEVFRLVDAALAAADESPWRSMESAPKDGAHISVLNPYNSPWYGVWWEVPTNPRSRLGPHWRSFLGPLPFEPIKWAPLPAAPEVNNG